MVATGAAMTNVFPLLPKLVLNRQFVQDFIAQGAPIDIPPNICENNIRKNKFYP